MTRTSDGTLFDILLDNVHVGSMGDVFDLVERSDKGTMLEELKKTPDVELLNTLPPATIKMLDSLPMNRLYRMKQDAPYFGSCGGSVVLPLRYDYEAGDLSRVVVAVLWRPPCSPEMGSMGNAIPWDEEIPFEVFVEPEWLEPVTKEEFNASLN